MSPLASWPSSSVLSLFFICKLSVLHSNLSYLAWNHFTASSHYFLLSSHVFLYFPSKKLDYVTLQEHYLVYFCFQYSFWSYFLYNDNHSLPTFSLPHSYFFATFSSQPLTNLQHFLGLVTCSVSTGLMCSHHSSPLTERNTSVCPHI